MSNYTDRKIEGLDEKEYLLVPNETITFTIKCKNFVHLRMWFQEVNINVAKTKNEIEL